MPDQGRLVEFTCKLGKEAPLWDEFNPALIRLRVTLDAGVGEAPHDSYLYYSTTGILSAIRQGNWKLHFELPCFGYANASEPKEYLAKLQKKPYVPELFNLKEDVGEKRDRAAEMPERVKELQALAREKAITEGR